MDHMIKQCNLNTKYKDIKCVMLFTDYDDVINERIGQFRIILSQYVIVVAELNAPFLYICGNFQCSVDYSKTTRKLLSVVRKCSGTYKIKANALPGLNCWICFAPAVKRWFYCAVLIFLSFIY